MFKPILIAALLAIVLITGLLLVWVVCNPRGPVFTTKIPKLHEREAMQSEWDELRKNSTLVPENGVLGLANPTTEELHRYFSEFDIYDEGTERIIWCFEFKPSGLITFLPLAIQVWGERTENELYYFKIPKKYTDGRQYLLYEETEYLGPKVELTPWGEFPKE